MAPKTFLTLIGQEISGSQKDSCESVVPFVVGEVIVCGQFPVSLWPLNLLIRFKL